MTDKTDLIEQNDNPLITMIADLGDITIDKRRRWSIEFDDYGIQGVIDVLKQHFIEQACEAVDSLPSSCGINLVCKDSVEQVIRDKFK